MRQKTEKLLIYISIINLFQLITLTTMYNKKKKKLQKVHVIAAPLPSSLPYDSGHQISES